MIEDLFIFIVSFAPFIIIGYFLNKYVEHSEKKDIIKED